MIETLDETTTCCTFVTSGLWFGLDVRGVQEVVRSLPLTPVPRTSADIRGLANIRGQIIAAIDLRRRLGLPEPDAEGDAGREPFNLVVRSEDGPVSLLVEEIREVAIVDRSEVEEPPDTLKGRVRDHLIGVAKQSAGLLLLLDATSVIAEEAR